MNLQVLPLRVLVSRQVIRDRMDYTGYLTGKTKSDLDVLDRPPEGQTTGASTPRRRHPRSDCGA